MTIALRYPSMVSVKDVIAEAGRNRGQLREKPFWHALPDLVPHFEIASATKLRLSFTIVDGNLVRLFIDIACDWAQLLLGMIRQCGAILYTNKLKSLCQ
jgi:hypothetical protein